MGGGADVGADVGEEALVRVGGRVEGPGDEEGAEDLVGLIGSDFIERFFEEAAGLGFEMIEAGAVEGLAGLGGGTNEEIEELGGAGFDGAGASVGRGLEQGAERLESRKLGGGEESGSGIGCCFRCNCGDLGGGWRLLGGDRSGSGGGRGDGLDKSAALHRSTVSRLGGLALY